MSRTTSTASTRRLLAGFATIGILATACGSGDSSSTPPPSSSAADAAPVAPATAGDAAVDVKDFLFAPKEITVAVGTTVTWTNQDRFGHTATSGAPGSETGDFDIAMGLTTDKDTTGLSGSTTFDTAGTFEYFCRYHPSMVGTITVT